MGVDDSERERKITQCYVDVDMVIHLGIILAVIFLAVRFPLAGFRPLGPLAAAVVLALILVSHGVASSLRQRTLDRAFPPTESAELTARASELANRIGVPLKRVLIDESPSAKRYAKSGITIKGCMRVSRAMVDGLSPEEMDFALVRAAAQSSVRYVPGSLLQYLLAMAVVVFLLALAGWSALPLYGFVVLVLPALFVPILATFWLARLQDRAADRLALRTTGNLAAAQSAVTKIALLNSKMPIGERNDAFPGTFDPDLRIRDLTREAERMGIISA